MTPAEHAATVREALRRLLPRTLTEDAYAALDALQAQAEQADAWMERDDLPMAHVVLAKLKAAEAERDRLQQQVALAVDAHDRLAEDYDTAEQRVTAMEQERDRLAAELDVARLTKLTDQGTSRERIRRLAARVKELEAALRKIADGTWNVRATKDVDARTFARAALDKENP